MQNMRKLSFRIFDRGTSTKKERLDFFQELARLLSRGSDKHKLDKFANQKDLHTLDWATSKLRQHVEELVILGENTCAAFFITPAIKHPRL